MKFPTTARALFLSLLLLPGAARAIDDVPVPPDGITGKDIYQKVLDNKLHTAYLEHRMISTDPGGSVQTLAFWSRFKDPFLLRYLSTNGVTA